MKHLDKTTWNDLQTTEGYSEKRFYHLGLVDAVKKSSGFVDYLLPSTIKALETMSGARSVSVPFIKDKAVVVSQTPSFDVPANLLESDTYSFTAVDIVSGFRYYPAIFENNQIDEKQYLNTVMLNVADAMGKKKEEIIAAKLEELKTQKLEFIDQSNTNVGVYNFNETTDTLEVDKDGQNSAMFANLNAIMDANELSNSYNIVTSPNGLLGSVIEAQKYGVANQSNIQWNQTLLPMDSRFQSKTISVGDGNFQGWFIGDGEIGVISNFPYDFRANTVSGTKKWEVSDVELPRLRSRCNIYSNNEATDATSMVKEGANPQDSNLKMTTFKEQLIWDRFYLVHKANSDRVNRASGVVKIKGLNS